jgi:glycosyltransferase involved in cell wall biosynthesis
MTELPVAVVIPTIPSREGFLASRCLPAVKANAPAEIELVQGGAGPSVKRNAGARRTSSPFIFFCDDDVVLAPTCLSDLTAALYADPKAGFAYCDRTEVVHRDGQEVRGPLPSEPFSVERLRAGNYISTMSLVRRSAFPGFDTDLRCYEDWDLWLTITERGWTGAHVAKPLFDTHRLGDGLLQREGAAWKWTPLIRGKHGLS